MDYLATALLWSITWENSLPTVSDQIPKVFSRRSYMRVERQTSSLTQATAASPSRMTFSFNRSPGLICSGR